MIDLVGELYAAQRALTAEDRALIAVAGVPDHMIGCGLVGVARIIVDRDTYQPCEDGRRAFITPVRVADPTSPEHIHPDDVVQFAPAIDLVAWHPARPERWALRAGSATWLGAIEPQYCQPLPVPIRRSPLAWLRAAGSGLCILASGARDAQALLLLCHRLVAEDEHHARQLLRLLERPFPIPEITIASADARRAA